MGDFDDAAKRSAKAQSFANSNGLAQTVYVGELLVHDTNACNRRAKLTVKKTRNPSGRTGSRVDLKSSPEKYTAKVQAQCAKLANRALDIFQSNPEMAQPKYVASAANSVGYSHERKGDYLEAALSYQISRNAIEESLGRQNGLVAHTIGRWVNARARIKFDGKLEQAKAAGLCDCWPYKQDTPKVEILDTGSSVSSSYTLNNQFGSGYAILQADVSDNGEATNIRVLESWPKGAYEAKAKRNLKNYKFAPKTGAEPIGFRKDVTMPFTYTIYDRESGSVY